MIDRQEIDRWVKRIKALKGKKNARNKYLSCYYLGEFMMKHWPKISKELLRCRGIPSWGPFRAHKPQMPLPTTPCRNTDLVTFKCNKKGKWSATVRKSRKKK